MLSVERAMDLQAHAGQHLGTSDWFTVKQGDIDAFARLSGDDNWIHVDPVRAAQDMPSGRTIAHGLFLLSLIPWLQRQVFAVRLRGRGLNYGYDRVRFLSPVPVDSRIRLHMALVQATAQPSGTRVELESTIEIDGSGKPALVARGIILIEDA